MYCPVDYKCEKCDEITEYDKGSALVDAPKNIECSHCGSKKTHRVFGCQGYSVAEGIMGNAKNGYSKGIINHPSTLFHGKGTKIK